MNLFISNAYAQAAQAQPNALMQFVPFIAIFMVFYFLMIRPQKKQQQELQEFLNNLKSGDEVYTKSGLIGKVTGLTEKIVTLEVEGGTKVKYLRNQIGGSLESLLRPKSAPAKAKKA